jgi:hypothetical protein
MPASPDASATHLLSISDNASMLALLPYALRVLLSLPHFLVLGWLVWLAFVPRQVSYLLRKHDATEQLRRTSELMSFKEVFAVGCVGGFILLTFITAYCCYLTLRLAGILN